MPTGRRTRLLTFSCLLAILAGGAAASRQEGGASASTGESPEVTRASIGRDGLGGSLEGQVPAQERRRGFDGLLKAIQKRDLEIGTLIEKITALTQERDTARGEVADLKQRLKFASRERVDLLQQLETIRRDIGDWAEEVDALRQEARAVRQGARYLAGSKKELRESGVISGGFLKGTNLQRLERLEILDLSRDTDIVLQSREHGLPRIQKVRLLPAGFERDQDYAVDLIEGGAAVRVSLLDVNKFKRSTFVVVLE
jgi:hypothetical protein